jgi:hypothetical protein
MRRLSKSLMGSPRLTGTLAAVAALATHALALASCECLSKLCPEPFALTINVTAAATGDPVTGALVQVSMSGSIVETTPCTPACEVPGTAGTYSLEVRAPGFQTAHRIIAVQGTTPSGCECGTAITEHLDIAIVASS